MAGSCPSPGAADPLVRSLIGVVDCNVQQLIYSGYDSLFRSTGAFSGVLTVMLTLYVALIGYQLLLGRSQLNITDFALTAVKLGVVLALATQWGAYQQLVYHFLFYGPQQIANVILHNFSARGSAFGGDVFDGLQRAFVDLTSFSPATPPGAPAATIAAVGGGPTSAAPGTGGALSTLLSKQGFDAILLLSSAVILVVSSLGVLLASKIVLGILLATGPIFIAMLLFDSTRGIFEGWLRASLAFAFAPLAVTLMLGIALTMLEPSLQAIEAMRDSSTYQPGVAFAVMVLVIVFAGVSIGMVVGAGVIAGGFKIPRLSRAPAMATATSAPETASRTTAAPPPRANRTAQALAAQVRRDGVRAPAILADIQGGGSDRRTVISTAADNGRRDYPVADRLGQAPRRNSTPRAARSGVRSG